MKLTQNMAQLAERARCGESDAQGYREKLLEYGFTVLDSSITASRELESVMAEFGVPVEYKFGTTLTIQPQAGTRNSQFTSRGMPLHTDAVLNAGNPVSFIGMQCLEAPAQGGETLLASSAAFFTIAPPDLVTTLRGVQIEYRSRVDDYYTVSDDGIPPVAAPIRVDPVTGGDALHLALEDPRDDTRNYSTRVLGYSEDESAALLAQVAELLLRPEVSCAHRWRVGEILIVDNRRMLHGRNAFPEGAGRRLVRFSVA